MLSSTLVAALCRRALRYLLVEVDQMLPTRWRVAAVRGQADNWLAARLFANLQQRVYAFLHTNRISPTFHACAHTKTEHARSLLTCSNMKH